jgi:putative DNA methylase
MTDNKRLIEVDFPLEQVSLDSVHEKNVRHGHISTLHIWPARRPLAASRAALIATLLPDSESDEERKAIYRRLAGEVVETIEKKTVGGRTIEKVKRETRGGILHWGQESSPDLDWFREKINIAHGGRAPKVLDPFAGGGAIPLEAMRLGCEVTAIDINPVAYFILKCTLEYPQRLAGHTRPLPDFALKDSPFMEAFFKAKGFKGGALDRQLAKMGLREEAAPAELALTADGSLLEADLAWHVRAWGRQALAQARRRLASRYPSYAEFQASQPGGRPFDSRPLHLLELDADGNTHPERLNVDFDDSYLKDPRNPRWIAKPTVAYLWARTVRCKGCRSTVPLLRTRWLVKKDKKRVLLTMTPNSDRTGVIFDIEASVPVVGGNAAQRREHDKRRGAGTMSRSGVQCPCCPSIMTMEDIRLDTRAGRLGTVLTALVVEGPNGKEYRLPTAKERECAAPTSADIEKIFAHIPYGIPVEETPQPAGSKFNSSSLRIYGLDAWKDMFTGRQLLAIGTIVDLIRKNSHSSLMGDPTWQEAIVALVACAVDKVADRCSSGCTWDVSFEKITHVFTRYALPFTWDFAEINPLSDSTGSYEGALEWIARVCEHCAIASLTCPSVNVMRSSALSFPQPDDKYDCIITDPPYYDAISYADIMDFFYVWLRRLIGDLTPTYSKEFFEPLSPKWSPESGDGELIDNPTLYSGDKEKSLLAYENGMSRCFQRFFDCLRDDGRFVLVFANKNPKAWESLVAAIIRSGFVVDGSWPIQTEMGNRQRAQSSAALSSSIWLVAKKRLPSTRPGWDVQVLAEMRERIHTQLRAFWDAGIRGPDFVWAATGPALEVFSKYPVVKKADEPNTQMTVSEFLREVRRFVVDFVVGRVLTHGEATEMAASLDDVTTYYLLHRNDFGLDDAPIGACILYALSCNLSDGALADRFDILSRTGGRLFDDLEESESGEDEPDAASAENATGGKGNKVRLKAWNQRKGKTLGFEAPGGRPVPLIDQAHRLMHLWRAGQEAKVDEYLDTRGLKRNALFAQLLQALIELAATASEERSILESLSNHIASRGGISAPRQIGMEV